MRVSLALLGDAEHILEKTVVLFVCFVFSLLNKAL